MDKYGSRDGNIIIDYYLDGNTDLKIIAKKYNVSRERIRQIETRAIAKLKKLCKDKNFSVDLKNYIGLDN